MENFPFEWFEPFFYLQVSVIENFLENIIDDLWDEIEKKKIVQW